MRQSIAWLAMAAMAALTPGIASAGFSEEDLIRNARAESNAAIAAHDLDRLAPAFTEDANVVGGNGGVITGMAQFRAKWAQIFADPAFVAYVRTPERVTVAADQSRAAEQGRWSGRFHGAAGDKVLSGDYLAQWVRVGDGQWRIHAELYVTLGCQGACKQ